MRPCLSLLVTLALAATACGTTDLAAPEGIEQLRSEVAFQPARVTTAQQEALAAGDLAFTVDLLRLVADGDDVFISPMSIATAMGMLEVGARGDTLAEIQAVLHESTPVHSARGALISRLQTEEELPPDVEADPFVIRSVNSLWLQRGYPVLAEFLDTLSRDYDAGVFLVDYVADPEGARVGINDWVTDQTEQRIEDLIPPGMLGALTRLVLTNAVYFKAGWETPFDPTMTADHPFVRADGTAVMVPTMRTADQFAYLGGEGFQAVWLPYWGGTTMLAILPDATPQAFLAEVDAATLLAARDEATFRPFAELALPRFEFESEFSLNAVLRSLGMSAAFQAPPGPNTADFSGITEMPEVFVTDVVHKAFVAVDEEGTEAAAATAVVMAGTSAPLDEPLTLRFDRPFIFLIQDDASGAPIFAGVVEDPSS